MNHGIKHIIILSIILTLVGCGKAEPTAKPKMVETTITTTPTSTSNIEVKDKKKEEVIPEPYTLAKQEIEKGDLDTTIKYLDLTIKDFPDSPYTYNAHVIKVLLLGSKLYSAVTTSSSISKGIDHKSVLLNKEDISQLKSYLNIFDDEKKLSYAKYKESLTYIFENYNEERSNAMFGELKFTPSAKNQDLSFFEDVGYPVPKTVEVEQYKEMVYQYTIIDFINSTIKDAKIAFPEFFLYSGNILQEEDKELILKINNEVIKLTENDKYSKVRLKAQGNIESLTKTK